MRKIISGLFLLGAIVFLIIAGINIYDVKNITNITNMNAVYFEVLVNLFYLSLSIICLIVSSSLYILETINKNKSKK